MKVPVNSHRSRTRMASLSRSVAAMSLTVACAPVAPAASTRHPHLATPPRAGHVRVDMHMHTMWSGDATTTPEELADAVAASGIDVLCVTDHNTINGALALGDVLPCRIVVGEEVRTHGGEIIGL